jgi:Tfp pilus assembly protein PilO
MQTHRILSLGSILAMLLIPVIGWFLVAQPQFAAATAADHQRNEIDGQIAASAAIVAQLKADSLKLPELNDELNDLRGSIPADIDPSGYLDGLGALATISGVSITALTVGDPMAYSPATPPVEDAVVPQDGDAEPDAEAEPTAAPVAVDDPAFVTNPLISGENFVAIPVSIEVNGEWESILAFVHGLQTGDRLFLVSTLSTSRDQASAAMTATVGGFIYAIPTGVEGHPRPVSTTVKQLTVPEAPDDETEGDDAADADADSEDTPTP